MKSRSYSQYFQSFSVRLDRDISANRPSRAKTELSNLRQWPLFRKSCDLEISRECFPLLFPNVEEITAAKLFYLVCVCELMPDKALEIFDIFDVELGSLEDVSTSAFGELIGFSEPIDPLDIAANEAFALHCWETGLLSEFVYLGKIYTAIGRFRELTLV